MRLDIEVRSSGPGLLRYAGSQVIARAAWPAPNLPLFYALQMWGEVARTALHRDGVAVIIRVAD